MRSVLLSFFPSLPRRSRYLARQWFRHQPQRMYAGDVMKHLSSWRDRTDELPVAMKAVFMLGAFFQETYQGRFYAKAQNLGRQLRAATIPFSQTTIYS